MEGSHQQPSSNLLIISLITTECTVLRCTALHQISFNYLRYNLSLN